MDLLLLAVEITFRNPGKKGRDKLIYPAQSGLMALTG
jgi:hypothetical protein